MSASQWLESGKGVGIRECRGRADVGQRATMRSAYSRDIARQTPLALRPRGTPSAGRGWRPRTSDPIAAACSPFVSRSWWAPRTAANCEHVKRVEVSIDAGGVRCLGGDAGDARRRCPRRRRRRCGQRANSLRLQDSGAERAFDIPRIRVRSESELPRPMGLPVADPYRSAVVLDQRHVGVPRARRRQLTGHFQNAIR